MTRERAKELLPIIEAYANGEAIQFSLNGGVGVWYDAIPAPNFGHEGATWRIKPKPLERWVNVYESELASQCTYRCREDAEASGRGHSDYLRTIKMREVES